MNKNVSTTYNKFLYNYFVDNTVHRDLQIFMCFFLFSKMSRKRMKALTMDEIAAALQEHDENTGNDDDFGDVIIVPPDVNALTDKKDIADDKMGEVLVQDVPGTLEIHTESNYQNEDDEPDHSKPTKKRKLCKSVPKWKYVSPKYTKLKARDVHYQAHLHEMREALESLTPVEIFEQLMTPEIYDHIIKETVRYATTYKNAMNFKMSIEELEAFIGVLLFSSYHILPSEQHYWSNDEDLGISLVKNALSRNRFQMLKWFIHFIDNSEAKNNKHDKGFKVRSLYTMLQQYYMKFSIFEENLSIDEMIVCYYGHHSLKQFICGKPIRFEYKLWALSGVSEQCYNFDLYCGKTVNTEKNSELLHGSKVVLKMLSELENLQSCTMFFDNLFADYPLLVYLRNLGFQATGTLRENRLSKCPLKDSKLLKKEKRGSYDYRFHCNEEILIVKWLDNKCVTVGTNYDTVEQTKTAQ